MDRREGYAPGWDDDALVMMSARTADERARFVMPLLSPRAPTEHRRPDQQAEEPQDPDRGIAAPTATRHLDVLRRAGLIETERITGFNYHRPRAAGLEHARELLTAVLDAT